jgi:hypothetical protein
VFVVGLRGGFVSSGFHPFFNVMKVVPYGTPDAEEWGPGSAKSPFDDGGFGETEVLGDVLCFDQFSHGSVFRASGGQVVECEDGGDGENDGDVEDACGEGALDVFVFAA